MNKKSKQNIFKNKIILHAFAAIILSIFIVFGLYNWSKISVNPDEKITLPDLKGMTLQEAEEYLNTKGLIAVVIDSVYNKEAKPGEIINQDPAPDIPVKPGRKIYLTINKFQKPFMKMPNFIDLSLRQAQVLANTYDLKVVGVEYVPSSCKGCIVGQKYKNREIKPGEPVPFGAPIVLVAGMGNEGSVSLVPYVINMSLGEAVAVIQSKGFNLGAEIYDETVKNASDSLNAKVFKQQPTADGKTLFPMGESIDLWLTLDQNKIQYNPPVINDSLQP